MDKSKEAMEARLEEWTQKIKEREESGISVAEFCEIYDIPESKYYYWTKRVKQARQDNLPNEIVDVTAIVKGEDVPSNIPVVAKSKSKASGGIDLLVVKIDEKTPARLISDVIKAAFDV